MAEMGGGRFHIEVFSYLCAKEHKLDVLSCIHDARACSEWLEGLVAMVSPEVIERNGSIFLCPSLPPFDGRHWMRAPESLNMAQRSAQRLDTV